VSLVQLPGVIDKRGASGRARTASGHLPLSRIFHWALFARTVAGVKNRNSPIAALINIRSRVIELENFSGSQFTHIVPHYNGRRSIQGDFHLVDVVSLITRLARSKALYQLRFGCDLARSMHPHKVACQKRVKSFRICVNEGPMESALNLPNSCGMAISPSLTLCGIRL
jgi:hypothetical protein